MFCPSLKIPQSSRSYYAISPFQQNEPHLEKSSALQLVPTVGENVPGRRPRSAARCLPSNLLMCGHTRGHESEENIWAILRLLISNARANATEFPAQQRCASSAVGDGPTVAWEIAANTIYRVEHKVKSRPSIP